MDDKKNKAIQYAAIATPIITIALSKWGVSSEIISGVIEGVCLIGLALAPSVLSVWKGKQ